MIVVEDLHAQAGTFSLKGVSFTIPSGKYCVLMGRTGSGKTTLLESLCGLKTVVSGRVLLDGRDVTNLKAAERNVGLVPQDGALFSTMTVRAHLEFALRIRKWPADAIARRVEELANLLQVAHLLHRRPAGLSGGETQRVALGRALSFHPQILCLDEPLSALDDDTRLEMIALLKKIQRETGVTSLHVTHNKFEAERLADLRLRIVDGRLVEQKAEEAAPEAAASGNGDSGDGKASAEAVKRTGS